MSSSEASVFDDSSTNFSNGTRQQFGDQFLKASDTLPTLPHRPVGDVLAASLCIDLPTTVIDCLDQNYTVVTLLPKTRDVMFVVLLDEAPETPEVIRVPWETAVRVAGHRMKQEVDVWPERWLVDTFPSEAELAPLRAAASP